MAIHSIADDTIYKLAVDSAAYPEQATVLLLDDGVIRMDADGRGTETFRQVTQVLQERAVKGFEERQFGYDPDHQQLTINWIRVLSRTGQVISAKPSQTQLSDVPAAMANPVYVHRKVLHTSLSGVAVGTLVDISYTIEERQPYRQGDFFESWSVNAATTVRRSRLLIDVPKDLALRLDERNLNFQKTETVVGNRKVYEWATRDVAWNRPEMYEPGADSDHVSMWLSVSAPGSWSDIGHWYAGLAHAQLSSGSQIQDTVRRITAHAATLDDSIRAIHRWVAQDVRYVSVSLGIGGYQPRAPATVVSTGFGDCKDKATLFIAALSDIGVQAFPVLLNAGGRPDRHGAHHRRVRSRDRGDQAAQRLSVRRSDFGAVALRHAAVRRRRRVRADRASGWHDGGSDDTARPARGEQDHLIADRHARLQKASSTAGWRSRGPGFPSSGCGR